MIGCHRQDLATWEWAKDINGVLEHELPDARSRIARAKTAGRLASLIGTDQLDTAVLSQADAKAMQSGSNGFEPYGAIEINAVANELGFTAGVFLVFNPVESSRVILIIE